ncbi:MAG: ATP-binding protein [Actinomycetota bacterium]|nr:ATP-binding protein [Actinomycetota bacterium]
MESGSLAIGIGVAVAIGVAAAMVGSRAGRRRALVAERRAAEATEELARREATSREAGAVQDLILDSMQEGILLFGADRRSAFVNDALEHHLGARPGSMDELLPVDLREMVRGVVESSVPASIEVERGAPSRWLRVAATPAGDGAALVVVTDITESRRIEAVRRDFVTNASHELKTPVASIQATAETLRGAIEDGSGAAPRFAVQLEHEALRLSRIMSDLLDLSRLESGSEDGEPVGFDTLVRDEVERFQEQAHAAGVFLSVAATDPAAVRGSARDLSLLVRNLVDNAIRYTQEGGTVLVRVAGDADGVTLTVRDSGAGIPSRDLPRVFERFYRVDRARSRETGGTGLGLAIVRHVAENHGGSASVVSEFGIGSTFTVRLPSTGSRAFDA